MDTKNKLAEWKIEHGEEMKSEYGHELGFMSKFSEWMGRVLIDS